MRKLFLLLTFVIAFSNTISADEKNPTPVIIRVLSTGNNNEHDEIPRSPLRVPYIYIEDRTLYFTSSCIGYTLQLLKDGNVIYSYLIPDDTYLELPEDFSGEYEIRLVNGVLTFAGTIVYGSQPQTIGL